MGPERESNSWAFQPVGFLGIVLGYLNWLLSHAFGVAVGFADDDGELTIVEWP